MSFYCPAIRNNVCIVCTIRNSITRGKGKIVDKLRRRNTIRLVLNYKLIKKSINHEISTGGSLLGNGFTSS